MSKIFNLVEFNRKLLDFIQKSLEESEDFKNYKVFYKVMTDDNCSDYIVYSLDLNSTTLDMCQNYDNSILIKLVFNSNYRENITNLKLINFILNKLLDNNYLIQDYYIIDSIVSKPCTELITNLNIRLIGFNNHSY